MAMSPGGAHALACTPQLRLACALLGSVVASCLAAANLVSAWNFGCDFAGASSREGFLWAVVTTAICASKIRPPMRRPRGWESHERLRAVMLATWWAAATMLSLMAWTGAFAARPPELVSAADVLAHISALPPSTLEVCLVAFCAAAFEILSILTTSCARHQWQLYAEFKRGGATTRVRSAPDKCRPHGGRQPHARTDTRHHLLNSKTVTASVYARCSSRLRVGIRSRALDGSGHLRASWQSGSEGGATADATRLAAKIDKPRCANHVLRDGGPRLHSERWPRAP